MAKMTNKNKPSAKNAAVKKSTAKKKTTQAVKTKKTATKKPAKTVKVKNVAKKESPKTPIKSKAKIAVKKTPKTAAKVKKTTTKSTSTTKTGRKVEVVTSVAKAPKKIKGYSKKELNEFKLVIVEKRAEIIEQLQNLKDQMMDSTTGTYVNENSPYSLHMAEQGTDAQEREKLYLWAQRETKFLGYLEDALQRIENGSYGICIDSLELKAGPHLIPKNRLLAVPHTQHCVDCKNKKK